MAKLDEQINRLGLWAVLVVLITFVITLFLPLDAPGGLSATQVERVDWLQEQPKHLYFGLDQSTACHDGADRRVSQHNLANQTHQPAARPRCRPRHVRIIYCLFSYQSSLPFGASRNWHKSSQPVRRAAIWRAFCFRF